jgi:hypothetical protein
MSIYLSNQSLRSILIVSLILICSEVYNFIIQSVVIVGTDYLDIYTLQSVVIVGTDYLDIYTLQSVVIVGTD